MIETSTVDQDSQISVAGRFLMLNSGTVHQRRELYDTDSWSRSDSRLPVRCDIEYLSRHWSWTVRFA